jgi:ATP-dependent exoDNAse (exonuclease V) beta subunit
MRRTPFVHRLIEASAGSGKTFQLTNCYLALLAAGIEPDKIVATTFTRKAAGEILDRVLERLAQAASSAAKAGELASEIGASTAAQKHFVGLLRLLLRDLHRVRISTIDSFNLALAGGYALELGLPAGWAICEEVDNDRLYDQSLEQLLEQDPDELSRLFSLLNKGDAIRSVQSELQKVVHAIYQSYRESERTSWECIEVPARVAQNEVATAGENLRAFDLSLNSKGMQEARAKDLERFQREDWKYFLSTGIAAKVHAGEAKYSSQPVPPGLVKIYEPLVRHARWALLRRLADQTKATWELLDRFHKELWPHKQATGRMRFDELTLAIVQAHGQREIDPENAAFRLDGAVEHLLLDEFQDTSLPQWRVLEPFARSIVRAPAEAQRSFFCVGDVKQAIYRWRGGMAEILDTLKGTLGPLEEVPLDRSRRSAQPVIEALNSVFENLKQVPGDDTMAEVFDSWDKLYQTHTTAKEKLPGYVCLHTGPAQQAGRDQRGDHCEFVAKKIQEITRTAPGRQLGVLCRRNETVARMIFELRRLKVDASEEGGNALTDSPAVELILSLLTLADHAGHSVAWFHLQHSPLAPALASDAIPESLSRELRRQRLAQDFGPFVQEWAERLAPACDLRDRERLQQLIEMAYAYQARSTLRSSDFVSWVRDQRVPAPSSATVRVMTLHAAKGLEFDVVVLPELDCQLIGQPPQFVVGRDPKSLAATFVSRYADSATRAMLPETQQQVFEADRHDRGLESLCMLYVAMTRAIHALHIYIPGPRKPNLSGYWYNLLRHTLAPQKEWCASTMLYEHGTADWCSKDHVVQKAALQPQPLPRIAFRSDAPDHRRGLEHIAPSRREGGGNVSLKRVFQPAEGTGPAAGTLYHAWFQTIEWLDIGEPSNEMLMEAARKIAAGLPLETWNDLPKLLANFRSWLQLPEILAILQSSAYADPGASGFPAALEPIWKAGTTVTVEREQPFIVRDGSTFLDGTIDRVVWIAQGERIVAADVIDFKTDAISAGEKKALQARTEYYRPQLETYRRAVARLACLPIELVAARLVFPVAGRVVEVLT